MRAETLAQLRCPACRGTLALEGSAARQAAVTEGSLRCPCGQVYPITDGIPDLVFPRDQPFHDEDAQTYDTLISFIARLLKADEQATRSHVVDLLELEPGARVLEIACGPASNLPLLLDRVGPTGEVVALDISADMVRLARDKLGAGAERVELMLANGVHLPFADHVFDAVLHIGTLNRFPDIPMALAEMARVVKVGGKVVAGDEGLGPWLNGSDYARILNKFGGLFEGAPPLDALPTAIEEVRLHWLMGHAYFAIELRTTADPPELDLDVQLPGRSVTVRDVLEAQKPRS